MAGGENTYGVEDKLGYAKAIIILILVAMAISAPTFAAKMGAFDTLDPAWFSLVVGAIVSLVSYGILRLFIPNDLGDQGFMSTVVVLGLVTAHVCVFEISDKLPRVPVYLLFGFVFYYHFTALEIFNKA